MIELCHNINKPNLKISRVLSNCWNVLEAVSWPYINKHAHIAQIALGPKMHPIEPLSIDIKQGMVHIYEIILMYQPSPDGAKIQRQIKMGNIYNRYSTKFMGAMILVMPLLPQYHITIILPHAEKTLDTRLVF